MIAVRDNACLHFTRTFFIAFSLVHDMQGDEFGVAVNVELGDFLLGICTVRIVLLLECVLQDERWCEVELCCSGLFWIQLSDRWLPVPVRVALQFSSVYIRIFAAMRTDCVFFHISLPHCPPAERLVSDYVPVARTDACSLMLGAIVFVRGEATPNRRTADLVSGAASYSSSEQEFSLAAREACSLNRESL